MNQINRRELAKDIHENAFAKGFWDEKYSPEHYLMLVITELSEAVGAWRKDKHANREAYDARTMNSFDAKAFEEYIKDSLEDELADTYIRLLDLADGFGYDTSERDNKREYPFFSEDLLNNIYYLIVNIVNEFRATDQEANPDAGYVLNYLEDLADKMGIDLLWHIQEKMRYNRTRSYLHGKIF